MSGSNRGRLITIAGLAVVAIFLFFLIRDLSAVDLAYRHSAASASAKYERAAQTFIEERCFSSTGLRETDCTAKADEATREGQRKEQDLAAQNVTAWWTKIMGIAALIGMALSAIGVWLVKTTFEETRAGNVIARDAQRAWVTLDTEPILFRPNEGGGLYIRVNFSATNLGQTAATDFEFLHEILFHGDKEDGESVDQRCLAQTKAWEADIGDMRESTLPPGAKELSSIWQQYGGDEICWFPLRPGGREYTEIALLSAVFYRTTSHPEALQCSWRSWYLGSVGPEGTTILRMPKDIEVRQADLRVEPFRTALVHTQCTANDDSRYRGQ